jgi:hypothetical protein
LRKLPKGKESNSFVNATWKRNKQTVISAFDFLVIFYYQMYIGTFYLFNCISRHWCSGLSYTLFSCKHQPLSINHCSINSSSSP